MNRDERSWTEMSEVKIVQGFNPGKAYFRGLFPYQNPKG
jgi:hypothetical protein